MLHYSYVCQIITVVIEVEGFQHGIIVEERSQGYCLVAQMLLHAMVRDKDHVDAVKEIPVVQALHQALKHGVNALDCGNSTRIIRSAGMTYKMTGTKR